MKKKLLALLAAGFLAVSMASQASPVTFQFSFSNGAGAGSGNVSGTVTGRILGLDSDGLGQAATSILIDSFPGLDGALEDADATQWSVVHINSFNVAGGVLTAIGFAAQDLLGGDTNTFALGGALFGDADCSGGLCDAPLLTLDNGLTIIAGGTLTATAVPEPGSLALLGVAFAALGVSSRRRHT